MQKLTLKKIARELDVSISTVSKSLSDSAEISDDTRQKIKAFAKLYNYKPNNIALSLKNRKTKTIGVLVPQIVHHFFTTVISGIEKIANERGYNVIIGLSNDLFAKEVINMEMLANGSIDGFILSVAKETQLLKDYHHLEETISQGIPIVMFDRAIKEIKCDKVIVDDSEGARSSVTKLISLGSKNIGIITTKDYVNVGKLRTAGYKKALLENDIPLNENLILKLRDEINEQENIEELENEIQSFLERNPMVDGIFAVNEIYALAAMKSIRNLGKEIPRDIKVIGFTDGVLSKFATPSLSTVCQHGKFMGEEAARLLINRLEDENENSIFETVVVETELIERESTGQ